MPLITGDAFAADTFTTVADDATLPDAVREILSSHPLRKDRAPLLERNTPGGVRLKPEESPEELGDDVHRLSVVVIEFPKFADGRGFSCATMLAARVSFIE